MPTGIQKYCLQCQLNSEVPEWAMCAMELVSLTYRLMAQ